MFLAAAQAAKHETCTESVVQARRKVISKIVLQASF